MVTRSLEFAWTRPPFPPSFPPSLFFPLQPPHRKKKAWARLFHFARLHRKSTLPPPPPQPPIPTPGPNPFAHRRQANRAPPPPPAPAAAAAASPALDPASPPLVAAAAAPPPPPPRTQTQTQLQLAEFLSFGGDGQLWDVVYNGRGRSVHQIVLQAGKSTRQILARCVAERAGGAVVGEGSWVRPDHHVVADVWVKSAQSPGGGVGREGRVSESGGVSVRIGISSYSCVSFYQSVLRPTGQALNESNIICQTTNEKSNEKQSPSAAPDAPAPLSDEPAAVDDPEGHAIALSPRGSHVVFLQRPLFLHAAPTPAASAPELSEASRILTDAQVRALQDALPDRHRLARWALAYSTLRHGVSLSTLYRKAQGKQPCLLVIDDAAGYVFGAFLSEAVHVSPRYYGTGETFLFQLKPSMEVYRWSPHLKTRTDFFIFGAVDSLAVGGGGNFGLWLDQELARGTSMGCTTFSNPCLASAEEFKIMNVELWCLE